MPDYTPRQIAQAMRCQMMVGSYDGDRLCDCAVDCRFHPEDIEQLKNHPKVMEAAKRNWAEFQAAKERYRE